MSVQESLVEAWVSGGLLQSWGTESGSVSMELLKEISFILITSTIFWPQIKQQRENTAPIYQQKIGLMIYRAFPSPLEQDPVSPESGSPIRKLL